MDDNPAFQTFFSSDSGLMLATELDVWAYRLEDILYVGGLNVDGSQPNLRDAFIFEIE